MRIGFYYESYLASVVGYTAYLSWWFFSPSQNDFERQRIRLRSPVGAASKHRPCGINSSESDRFLPPWRNQLDYQFGASSSAGARAVKFTHVYGLTILLSLSPPTPLRKSIRLNMGSSRLRTVFLRGNMDSVNEKCCLFFSALAHRMTIVSFKTGLLSVLDEFFACFYIS